MNYTYNAQIALLKNLAKYTLLLACFCGLPLSGVLAQCGVSPNFSEGPQTSPPNLSCANSCDGQILALPSGGSSPYTYLWSTTPPQTIAAATGLCAGVYTVTLTDFTGCVSVFTDSIVAPSPVTAVFTEIPGCNGQCGGTAIVNVGGGCSGLGFCPYDYVFTNLTTTTSVTGQLDSILAFPNLCPGDYSISVVDQIPCPATVTNVTITEATPFTVASGSATTPTCPGDCNASVFIGMAGSLQPYTFDWSNGVNTPDPGTNTFIDNLCAGSYSVTVTDSLGCTKDSLNMIVTDPPTIVPAIASVDPTCAGVCDGSAVATIQSGGTAPFTYLWSNGQTTSGVTALCAGAGSVTVTDADGCDAVETYILNQTTSLTSTSASTIICATGGSSTAIATITVSNGTPAYTYLWSSGATTSTAAGLTMDETYSVTITDGNGCQLIESVYVTPQPCPIVIPNTFSPNDDDFNDTWFIENLSLYTQAELKVYNRWGDVVFSSTGYDVEWDGKYGSANLPAAVYYYVIEIAETGENYAGSVTIVR